MEGWRDGGSGREGRWERERLVMQCARVRVVEHAATLTYESLACLEHSVELHARALLALERFAARVHSGINKLCKVTQSPRVDAHIAGERAAQQGMELEHFQQAGLPPPRR